MSVLGWQVAACVLLIFGIRLVSADGWLGGLAGAALAAAVIAIGESTEARIRRAARKTEATS